MMIRNRLVLIGLFLAFTGFSQIQVSVDDWLHFSHDNLDKDGNQETIQRFDILGKWLDGDEPEESKVLFNLLVAPETGITKYSVKIVNIMSGVERGGLYEIFVIAYDHFGKASGPSEPLTIVWNEAAPTEAFDLKILPHP